LDANVKKNQNRLEFKKKRPLPKNTFIKGKNRRQMFFYKRKQLEINSAQRSLLTVNFKDRDGKAIKQSTSPEAV
jgi:hypothetical protein